MITITTPLDGEVIAGLSVGDTVSISGLIYCGRDAVLPRLVKLAQAERLAAMGIALEGAVIFHTAVSLAGVGPTSSNKFEIESSIGPLSQRGVKLHLGKGMLAPETVAALALYRAVYAVIPPVTALLQRGILSKRVCAFAEEGMEAFHLLEVRDFPAIIAVAHGRTIYE